MKHDTYLCLIFGKDVYILHNVNALAWNFLLIVLGHYLFGGEREPIFLHIQYMSVPVLVLYIY